MQGDWEGEACDDNLGKVTSALWVSEKELTN